MILYMSILDTIYNSPEKLKDFGKNSFMYIIGSILTVAAIVGLFYYYNTLLPKIEKFPETFKEFFKNYKILIIITFIIFIMISMYYYTHIVKPKLQKHYTENTEFVSENTSKVDKTATLYFFYTTWCPLCKQAKVEWNDFKSEINGVIKDTNIIFKEIDCDQDSATADKFKITGYPTIILIYNDKTYEYDAKPTKDTLTKFLNEVL